MILPGHTPPPRVTLAEVADESRRIRRLQLVVRLALGIIAEGQIPYQEASQLAAATRSVALTLFPEGSETYDLLYRPKFQRLLRDVYRLQ